MIYDVTVPITSGIPVWPSDPPVKLTRTDSIAGSYTIRLTAIEMGSHTGTHVDAPSHFIETGKTLDEIPLRVFAGPALVVDAPGVPAITREHIESIELGGATRILFKTDNSRLWEFEGFREDYVYMTPAAADALVRKGVELVGIDYLSIDAFTAQGHPTHHVLLPNNVVILEGLNLSAVQAGFYNLFALPLSLRGADGAPARVILVDDK